MRTNSVEAVLTDRLALRITSFEEIFDDTDIRGKGLNILRDLRVENPNLQEKGQWMIQSGLYTPTTKEELTTENNALRWYYPVITKVYRMFQYEETLYSPEGTDVYGSHILLRTDQSWRMNKDDYAIRLPETYLLRAEAYLNLNQKDKAATDINAVRIRAKATPVEASMVDIDYILDERLRELYYEELRTVTLCRLGKLYDRAKAYKPLSSLNLSNT
ncbi:MAG: RagB/SusD family nutrient uptake outer membrane protein [Parabacteroides sp.]